MLRGRFGSDMSRFRWWYRQTLWADQPGVIGRARMIKRRLARPLGVYSTSGVALSRWGGAVEARRGVSLRRQRATMCWLGIVHGIPPETYYRYRLFEPGRRRKARLFLHGEEHNRVLAMLNARLAPDAAAMIDEKGSFEAWCRENGLPSATTAATFADGRLISGEVPEGDLFAKPSDARGGKGALSWRRSGDGGYLDADDVVHDRREVVATLERRSLQRPYIVQERLRNHEQLRGLSTGSLCTLRLVTARPPGAEAVLLSASFGMPVGDSLVDNFHAGGICAAVEPATARLGPGARSLPEECVNRYDVHPDTEAPIAGVILPCFQEAVQLVLRAHKAAPKVAFVGWDVALTDDGPLLLEANVGWDAAMPQVPSGRALGETPYVSWLLEHLAACR